MNCAGNPVIVALGALLLVGCTEERQELPEHAYTTRGTYWRCERGYIQVDGACQAVEIPEHAYLTRNGIDWTCDRGHKRVEDQCQSVEIPEYAYLSYNGDDWKCERGFKRVSVLKTGPHRNH